jgi:hypothetical protein
VSGPHVAIKLAQLAQLDAGFDYFSMFCAA